MFPLPQRLSGPPGAVEPDGTKGLGAAVLVALPLCPPTIRGGTVAEVWIHRVVSIGDRIRIYGKIDGGSYTYTATDELSALDGMTHEQKLDYCKERLLAAHPQGATEVDLGIWGS